MRYFIRLNNHLENICEIRNFNEMVRGTTDRNLNVYLSIVDSAQMEELITKNSSFLEDNSIETIEIVNEEGLVIFSTSAYHRISSFQTEFYPTEDENIDANENGVLYRLHFNNQEEAEE